MARVHPLFLDNLYGLDNKSKRALKDCSELTSSTNSVCIESEEVTTYWNLITTSATYRFHMEHQPECQEKSKCGFLIKVSGISHNILEQFDIKLVLDKDEYPEDLHFHDLCVGRMHLVLGKLNYKKRYSNLNISWRGRPEYEEDGVVSWRGETFTSNDQSESKLVVYYNTDRNI